MQKITRRAALRATAAVAAVAVPGVAAAHSDDAHLRALYDEWDALLQFIRDMPGETPDEDLEPLDERLNYLERTIAATPAESSYGVLVKLRIQMWHEHESGPPGRTPGGKPYFDEIQVPSAWRDLERLVGEG